MKLTIREMSSPTLQMALAKLNGTQVNIKLAYKFKKLQDKVNEALTKIRSDYTNQIVNVHGKFDEKKQLIPAKTPWGFELLDPAKQVEFDAANDEFHNRVVEIDREPLLPSDFAEIKTSAAELTALAPLMLDLEEAPMEEPGKVSQIRR